MIECVLDQGDGQALVFDNDKRYIETPDGVLEIIAETSNRERIIELCPYGYELNLDDVKQLYAYLGDVIEEAENNHD